MSVIDNLRKDELKLIAEELGLVVAEGAKLVELKNIIEKSEHFSNLDLMKSVIDSVIEEIKSRKEEEKTKLELEKIKLAQLEKELEIANIRKESSQNSEFEKIKLAQLEKELEIANVKKDSSRNNSLLGVNLESECVNNNNLESFIKSIKTLTIPLPSKAESFNLFFQSLEKAFRTKNVPEEFKAEILLNILGEKANNLMIYVSEEDLSNYEKLKAVVLKEFQPTANECLNSFQKAQKLPLENYVQYASRLSASFEYYCQLRKVNDFKSLCELIVADKIFSSLDRELMTHIGVRQGESFFKPQELGRECDIYLSAKGRSKNEMNMFTKAVGNENKRIVGNKSQGSRFQKGASNVFLSEIKNGKCVLCKNNESHVLYLCPQFKKLSVQERINVIKINKLCFKCFLPNCNVKRCNMRNCFCGKPHSKMIHFPREEKFNNFSREIKSNFESTSACDSERLSGEQIGEFNSPGASNPSGPKQPIVATSFARNKTKNVLLSTVRVLAKDKFSQWQEIRCLLDSGSQACLITKDCVNRLQLKTEKINTLISCLNDSSMVVSGCVTATIANKDKNFEKVLDMYVVKKITDFVPNKVINVYIDIPNSIPLADYTFNVPGKIDMLLGAEIFYELLRPGQIYSQNSQLLLQNSCFGYVATGSLDQGSEAKMHCGLIREDDLNVTLKKFWETEELNVELIKSKEHAICEEHFERTHRRNEEGRYVVTMPLKDNPSCLGESRDIALKRLKSLWARLSRDENYLALYKNFMDEYKQLGHMREVKEDKIPDTTYYAPHHGVYRPEKSSTKLRVVFNCSSLTENNTSLNALQYNGGVIQNDLFTIMVGFRQHIYALTADVKMMYRMILIDQNQHCLQRILWSDSANEPPKTFELVTVTYGTVSAPYLAMRTLKQLSIDEECNFPKASPILRNSFYMDDVLFGAITLEEAKERQHELIEVMQKAGMQLHKWCANHAELSPNSEDYSFYNLGETKTLGVAWKPEEDCFAFNVEVNLSDSYTKREVLSIIAKIFDPLGLLGPIIMKAKIFMQRLWRLKIDWCDDLPRAEYLEWYEFILTLKNINNITVGRCIVMDQTTTIEIHGFADASERGFGAAIYCKSSNLFGKTSVKLIASKSRVAPVKSLTIPRLELNAAVLLARLMKKVIIAIKITVSQIYFWTDSTIVLAWIQREPIDLKQFVQNRIATIQELSSVEQWHHVPSDQNPADVLSRGANPDRLINHDLWWNGPSFLLNNDYPKQKLSELDPEKCEDFCAELKNRTLQNVEDTFYNFSTITVINFVHALLDLSNTYIIILRILSFIFRFVNNCRNPLVRVSGPIKSAELNEAELFLLKEIQREAFSQEINDLQVKNAVRSTSKLRSLNPFLDPDGIMRVGGRLGNSEFGFVKKHPAILPKGHRLTNLIVNYYHKRYLHVGPTNLLNHVREKFWPLRGRTICRKIVHECQTCFKANPIISSQLMGHLPKDRVLMDFPFNCSGVDLCGPVMIKINFSRKSILKKVYICLFVCFVFKAVHIEIVSDLTAESFIAALKRFVARRGKCAKLYSDNATNFVGANKEIKKFQQLLNKPSDKLATYLSTEGIDWNFIPPRAPNFGGLWEAAIKSFKYHFKRVVGGSNLTYEELLTVIVQIEGVLNSRPLSPISDDDSDFGVLTPAHFLINRPINSIMEPDMTNIKENRLKRWQKITKIVQSIWHKWHRNYLSELQQRNKWRFEKDNVRIGDLVLLVEENLPTNKWPLGRIVEVYYGNDRKIRVVRVKTQTGTFKRSISKICVLPMPD